MNRHLFGESPGRQPGIRFTIEQPGRPWTMAGRNALIFSLLIFGFFIPSLISATELPIDSVVQIDVVSSRVSYQSPWHPAELRRSGGSGFIIEGNRIVTNAHVVSRAEQIRIRRPSQRRDFRAKVLYIAHDCDLAILESEDPAFFQGAEPAVIGELPALNTEVIVAGFPIGGKRLSVTRGVVSRIDIDTYSHSEIDSHLTIQVDAAINPGNSGGPAFQNGKVIGVAFQVITGGENLGYLIPPVVVQKFLRDIRDGRYDGYIDLGILDTETKSPTARKALGVTDREESGVLVYRVLEGTSAEGEVKPGDLLLKVEGKPVSNQGDVEYKDRLVSYIELIDHKDEGETIELTVLRDGKELNLRFPAKKTDLFSYMRRQYENKPQYLLAGGYLFQPLNADLMQTYGKSWNQNGSTNILYKYYYSVMHGGVAGRSEEVVLTRLLADRTTLYGEAYESRVVESVNGHQVKGFSHFAGLLNESEGPYTVIRFSGYRLPLVLEADSLDKATRRVQKKYGIQNARYIEEGGNR